MQDQSIKLDGINFGRVISESRMTDSEKVIVMILGFYKYLVA
jgi:hypothetical protein